MSGQESISPSSTVQYSYASEEEKSFYEWIQQKTGEYLEEPLLDLRDQSASDGKIYKTIITGLFDDKHSLAKDITRPLAEILEAEGHLIIFVQLYTALYDQTDAGFNYWHKWNKSEIRKRITSGLEVVKMRYFNVLPPSDTPPKEDENNTMFRDLVTTFYLDEQQAPLNGLAVIVIAQKKV